MLFQLWHVLTLFIALQADPNAIDMHGSTALLEAVKNGNEVTMDVLLENKAQLCMPESLAASVLESCFHKTPQGEVFGRVLQNDPGSISLSLG